MGYSSDRGVMGAQCAENRGPFGTLCVECVEKQSDFGAQCLECMPVGWNTHAHSNMHQGGILIGILLLHLQTHLFGGKARPIMIPARQMGQNEVLKLPN
jgi:hypothetical protein